MSIQNDCNDGLLRQAIGSFVRKHQYGGMNLKAVLFDMDGVLFDSMKNHATAWHKAMKHYGMNLSCEEAYLHEGRTGAATVNIVSQRQLNRDMLPEVIEEIYQTKCDIFNSLPPAGPMPGAAELLQKVCAAGLIPVLVTGSGQKSLFDKLEHSFPGVFCPERMVTAYDVTYGKPNPEPYLMGLEKAGVQPCEAIVVENAPLGVRAGVAADIFTVAVNTGPLPDQVLLDEGANLLFRSMQELSEAWDGLLACMKP